MGIDIGNLRVTMESRQKLPDRVNIQPQKGWEGGDWNWRKTVRD